MLEILILIALCRNIAAKARAKGRSGGWFGFLLVALWIGGELCGGLAGVVFSVAQNGGGEPDMVFVYGGCLAGAVVGALIAFAIVSAIPPAPERGEYDDYDDRYDDRDDRDRDRDDPDDRPRRRGRDDDYR